MLKQALAEGYCLVPLARRESCLIGHEKALTRTRVEYCTIETDHEQSLMTSAITLPIDQLCSLKVGRSEVSLLLDIHA